MKLKSSLPSCDDFHVHEHHDHGHVHGQHVGPETGLAVLLAVVGSGIVWEFAIGCPEVGHAPADLEGLILGLLLSLPDQD